MDLVKIGKFIAALRKERGLTQEQLGQALGVTNKTVSRWETGVYLPPGDILLMMSELFGVSVNELLTGRRLPDREYKKAAEENLARAIPKSGFSLKEKIAFYKKRWLTAHIGAMVLVGIGIAAVFAAGLLIKNPLLVSITPLLIALAHGWRNNAMMAYVERNAYDGTGT